MIGYVTGDATHPVGEGPKIIAHVCNDYGGWGSGFVLALNKRWADPMNAYRIWAMMRISEDGTPFALGESQYVPVRDYGNRLEEPLVVANMIAQHGNSTPTYRAVDYDALRRCLHNLAGAAWFAGATVHMPRIGCGLGGGDWETVSAIIEDEINRIPVYVYDLPGLTTPPRSGTVAV